MVEKNPNSGRSLDTLLKHGWVENPNFWLPGFYWHMECGRYSLRKGFAKKFVHKHGTRFVIKEVCMHCKREVVTYMRKM